MIDIVFVNSAANIIVASFFFLLYLDGRRAYARAWTLSHIFIACLIPLGAHLDGANALEARLLFLGLGAAASLFMLQGAFLIGGRPWSRLAVLGCGGGLVVLQMAVILVSMRAAIVTGLSLHALVGLVVVRALLGKGRFYAIAGGMAFVRAFLLALTALGVALGAQGAPYRSSLEVALQADAFTILAGLILVYAVYREAIDVQRGSELRYRSLIERSPIGIVIHRGFDLLFVNQAYLKMFGYGTREEFVAAGGLLRHIYPDNLAKEEMIHRSVLEGARDVSRRTVFRHISSIGDVFLSVTTQRIEWEGLPAEQSLVMDETDRFKAESALRSRTIRDDLTGLCNRSYLIERLNTLVRQREHFALILMDLNRFKWINDTYGHGLGDRLLCEIGRQLSALAGQGEAVVRLGGDEFALLVVGEDAEIEAQVLADWIIRASKQRVMIDGLSIHYSVALGIAMHPTDAADTTGLMRCADLAMYAAKSDAAGSAFRFFDTAMNRRSLARMNAEAQLHTAIETGRIELYYQPRINAVTRSLVGFEALLRIVAADGSVCSPAPFIAVAEDTGLIHVIGSIVQRTVCRQVAEWMGQFGWSPVVSFNASLPELSRPGFDSDLLSIVAETDIPPSLIEIEVTESATGQSMSDVSSMLQRLAEQGIKSALDDFGTGYSSLGRLHELPIQVIKLDKCFVDRLPGERQARALAESVTRIGRSLDYVVVAEGVETEAQALFLKEAGYTQLQGYLFSRPMPAAEATKWVRQASMARLPSPRYAVAGG